MSDNDVALESVRRRQMLLASGLAAIVLGGAGLYFWAARPAPAPSPEDRMRKTIASAAKVDERAVWRARAEADLSSVSSDVKQNDTDIKKMRQENQDLKARLDTLFHSGLTQPPPVPVPGYAKETEGSAPGGANSSRGLMQLPPPPVPMTRSQAMSTPQDKAGFMARGSHSLPAQPGTQGGSAQAGPNPALGAAQSDGIVTLTWAAPASSVAAGSAEGSKSSGRSSAAPAAPAAPSADRRTFLTSGAFFSADLLMGLDAPTGGQAQQNPQPVLMRVTNNAFLPSRVRSTVKECFVTGDAFGDQSSERAYIRAERLSCVTHGGQAIEIQISAAVAGEDGKVGLRGRLVQKQGAILQQALLASVASGIGQAFRSAASTQSVSPLGTTSTVQPGKGFEAGFAGGISSAADRLANYYIALAEKLHPVIEVDAGRHVTVMIQQGFSMNSLDTTISGGDDE